MSTGQIAGQISRQEIIPAREYTAFTMQKGEILRITDVEGRQVADIICFNLQNLEEKLSNSNAVMVNRSRKITTGYVFYSDDCQPMLAMTADTVGVHHAGGAFCSEEVNFVRYGVRGTRNCRDNLTAAVAPWGITKHQLPGAFAPFMNYRFLPDGTAEIADPLSKPGDYVEVRAEMDLLVAISNCPSELNPCNGFNPTPLEITVYRPS